MSPTLPLSSIIFLPFSDFCRAPGNDHFLAIYSSSDQTNVKSCTKHTNELFIIAYRMSRLTNCTLLVFSINTDYQTTKFMKLGVSKLLSQTHLLCYCVSCDEFCQVQYIIVIESVTVYHQHVVQCSWILVRSCTRCLFSSIIV